MTEAFDAMADGAVKALYIMGENPMLSDPDIDHVATALRGLDFLVVQDIFLSETAALARRGPAGGQLRREGRHLHQHRAQGAAAAPGRAVAGRGPS